MPEEYEKAQKGDIELPRERRRDKRLPPESAAPPLKSILEGWRIFRDLGKPKEK